MGKAKGRICKNAARSGTIAILMLFAVPLFGSLLFVFQPVSAAVTITKENSNSGESNGGSSVNMTLSPAPDEGDLLVAAIEAGGTITIPSGWTEAVTEDDRNTIAYKIAGASDTGPWQYSLPSPNQSAWVIAQYSSSSGWPSNPVDVTDSSASAGEWNPDVTSKTSGTTGTTSSSDSLAFAAWRLRGGTAVSSKSWTNSFSLIDSNIAASGQAYSLEAVAADKILSSTGTQNTTFSWSGARSGLSGTIAVFEPEPGGPSKVAFTTSARTITAGTCSGAGSVITIQLQNDSSTATNPTGATTVRVSSNSPTTEAIYSDSSCSTQLTNGDVSFSTSENTKSIYIIDTRKSNPTFTLTAAKQSGPDTLTNGTQNITVNAGSVSRLILTLPGQTFTDGTGNSSSPSNRTAGSSFNMTSISATDAYNNVNTGYSGSKTLVYSGPSDAPDTSSPSYTTSVSFTNGQSTTTLSTTLVDAESTTITATDGGSYGYASSSVTVNAGAVENYVVTEASSTIIAGACSSATIQARDDYNNNSSTDTSTVTPTDNGTSVSFYTNGSCGSGTSAYTLSGGTSTAYYSSTKKQASFAVTMTKQSDTPTGTSGNIQVDPAAATALLIELPGETFVDGTGITGSDSFTGLRTPNATAGASFNVDIKAVDTYNNLVDTGTNNYTGSKTISWADSTAGNAPDTTSPDFPVGSISFTNGEADSQTITYYNAATSRTVEADDTVTTVNGTTSSTFTVQADSAENYLVNTTTPQTAGVAFNVTVTARDDWNNSLGSLYSAPAGTYTWSTNATNAPDTTSPSIGTLVQGNFSNGVATKSVTLYNNESSISFTATEPPSSTVTGGVSGVTVNPGSISANTSDSTVTGDASGSTETPLVMTITLKDTWRNPISGVNSSYISLSGTGSPSVIQPSSNTNASGQTTGSLSWTSGGAQTVSVQISTVSLVQNDGTTPDADGYLDNTHGITLTVQPFSSGLQGGSTIQGGTTIR